MAGGQADDFSGRFTLKVLSWNVDGLDEDEETLEIRTNAVIDTIQHRSPHIVYLQEVIAESLSLFTAKLGSQYSIHVSETCDKASTYFPAILVAKTCPRLCSDGHVTTYDFPDTTMGRHLLRLFVTICGIHTALFTTHLESLKDFSKKRKRQLKTCFEFITEENSTFGRSCIFGGDLNATDQEIEDVGLPASFVDTWEACGRKEEDRYTRDPSANTNGSRFQSKMKFRLDRLYLSLPSDRDRTFNPVSFELIGKERVKDSRKFPSDHWGIFLTLHIMT